MSLLPESRREHKNASMSFPSYYILSMEKSFHNIITWLETVYTNPSMLEIIEALWTEDDLVLDPECPNSLNSMCSSLREINLYQKWLGFLSIGMVDC